MLSPVKVSITVQLLPGAYGVLTFSSAHVGATCDLWRTNNGILRAVAPSMNDDARNGAPNARPIPSRRACPHCLNPNTIVADQRYGSAMRFCPMCDYSWVLGEGGDDEAAPKRGSE